MNNRQKPKERLWYQLKQMFLINYRSFPISANIFLKLSHTIKTGLKHVVTAGILFSMYL